MTISKNQQVARLTALMERNKGKECKQRDIPAHILMDLELILDRFKPECGQWSGHEKYHKLALSQMTNDGRFDFASLKARILRENPGLRYVR